MWEQHKAPHAEHCELGSDKTESLAEQSYLGLKDLYQRTWGQHDRSLLDPGVAELS
jgi:hypothetical protein